MFNRLRFAVLLLAGLALSVTGCNVSSGLDAVTVSPASNLMTVGGPTLQLTAIGTFGNAAHTTTKDITNSVAWSSSASGVAAVDPATGVVTAKGPGSATITATTQAYNGTISNSVNVTVTGGGTATGNITSLAIIPGSQALSSTGQTGQFTAIGTYASGSTVDVTNSQNLTWASTIPTIASISTYPAVPAGQAAGKSPGTTYITAQYKNSDQTVVEAGNTASVAVAITPAAEPLLTITVLPGATTIANLLGTGQYLAYGTFSTAPTVLDITNGFRHVGFPAACVDVTNTTLCPLQLVTWISTAPEIFPISTQGAAGAAAGLVTAEGNGTDDIYVTAINPDSTLVYSPSVTFNCPLVPYNASTTPITLGSCNQETIAPTLLVTLTVFNTGLNTTAWHITASSATGTPDVINCGPGAAPAASVCTATYPVNTVVTLTAPAGTGNFGGWSYNCAETGTVTAAGPNSCTVVLGTDFSSNVTVGAVFN